MDLKTITISDLRHIKNNVMDLICAIDADIKIDKIDMDNIRQLYTHCIEVRNSIMYRDILMEVEHD